MLYVKYSRPERNEGLEARYRMELKNIDQSLDVLWLDDVVFNQRHQEYEGRYAIIVSWPSIDPRWQLIQSGEIGNAPYDILGFLTEDIHNAETASIPISESIEQRVLALLASADNTKVSWKLRMKQILEKNKNLRERKKHEFLENEIHDLASYEHERGRNLPIINVPVQIK